MSTAPNASLQKRLLDMADAARSRAEELPAGEEREALLRKAEDAEGSAAVGEWLTSPGAKPPT